MSEVAVAPGRVGRGIAGETYWLPAGITLSGDRLRWPIATPGRAVEAESGLLDGFIALRHASDDRVLAFASDHGVLNLCQHGIPVGHSLNHAGGGCEIAGRGSRGSGEPIQRWRELAAQFHAAVWIAASLHLAEDVSPERWRELGVRSAPTRDAESASEWLALTRYAANWLSWTDVRVTVSWSIATGPGPVWGSGVKDLAGALALQLAAAICKATPPRYCRACGKLLDVSIGQRGRPRAFCSIECANRVAAKESRRDQKSQPPAPKGARKERKRA